MEAKYNVNYFYERIELIDNFYKKQTPAISLEEWLWLRSVFFSVNLFVDQIYYAMHPEYQQTFPRDRIERALYKIKNRNDLLRGKVGTHHYEATNAVYTPP